MALAKAIIIGITTLSLIFFLKNDYKRIYLKVDWPIPTKKPEDIYQEGET